MTPHEEGDGGMEKLLTPDELAGYLQVSTSALKGWRYKGTGPKFQRLSNGLVRYRRADVDEWLEDNAVEATP